LKKTGPKKHIIKERPRPTGDKKKIRSNLTKSSLRQILEDSKTDAVAFASLLSEMQDEMIRGTSKGRFRAIPDPSLRRYAENVIQLRALHMMVLALGMGPYLKHIMSNEIDRIFPMGNSDTQQRGKRDDIGISIKAKSE
jgi:hypothetical protein